jgi:hypothetical protein
LAAAIASGAADQAESVAMLAGKIVEESAKAGLIDPDRD